jgi:dTDP-glucose 4,6-dehydratase
METINKLMKVLVTGGNGFIGSNFIRYVLKYTNMEIINVDTITYAGRAPHPESSRYTFYKENIGSAAVYDVLLKHHPDYIVNFAAETHVDRSISFPDTFVDTNINGTYGLLKSLMRYMKLNTFRFVHISTDEVFGQLQLGDLPFKETTAYAPNSPYSATKASSDHLVHSFYHTYGLPAIITNCSNNYGPYQFPEKFIPVAILRAHTNKPIPIYGNGKNIRDWIYVEDHCEAIYHVMRYGSLGERYNIGGETQLSNNEIANRILLHLGKPLSLLEYVEDRKGHDFRYAVNISHIRNELGWQPKMDFNRGLGRTIEWYLSNLNWVTSCVNLE